MKKEIDRLVSLIDKDRAFAVRELCKLHRVSGPTARSMIEAVVQEYGVDEAQMTARGLVVND